MKSHVACVLLLAACGAEIVDAGEWVASPCPL